LDRGQSEGQALFTNPSDVFDDVQSVLGRKWQLRIVYQLLEHGPMGFSELKTELVGVSSKMLSESLTTLEEDGIVDREVVSEQPFRVEYSLTERGEALEPVVSSAIQWGTQYGLAGET
jgi:DNA-binding HxlR family transcriptional regulator